MSRPVDQSRVPATVSRVLGVPLALGLVTALALIDITNGPDTVLAGLMVAGPASASVSASPRGVVAVGAYAVALILAVETPDHLWGDSRLVYFLGTAVVVTLLSAYAAGVRERLATEGRANAAAFEESAARKAAILQSAPGAVITIDHVGKVLEVNP